MAVDKSDRLVTVAGASGFLGRYVVQELCRLGFRVRAVCRRPQRALFLKPLGGLGLVQIAGAALARPAGLAAAVAGSAAVLHLVGILKRCDDRRVGTECGRTGRSRWSPYHTKKKKKT